MGGAVQGPLLGEQGHGKTGGSGVGPSWSREGHSWVWGGSPLSSQYWLHSCLCGPGVPLLKALSIPQQALPIHVS